MAVNRDNIFNENTSPTPTQDQFLDQYGNLMTATADVAVHRVTNLAGTDTLTGQAEPMTIPASGYPVGLNVTFDPVNTSTGAVTLNIDGRGAKPVVARDGGALPPGALVAGARVLAQFGGFNFVLLTPIGGATTVAASRTTYDATTVWSNNFPADTLVQVELWAAGGGGGGGGTGTGGGGGAYATKMFRAGDLPSNVTITVPSGGAVDTDGGNCTFGSLLTAYGGGGSSAAGGGGGGEVGASSTNLGGPIGGGDGGTGTTSPDNEGDNALSIYGGGGGGIANIGGDAVYGGGGGGGGNDPGGDSVYGGGGGGDGNPGQLPAGGGGGNAAGGGGRCIITIFGD